jgi:hypothetical protein
LFSLNSTSAIFNWIIIKNVCGISITSSTKEIAFNEETNKKRILTTVKNDSQNKVLKNKLRMETLFIW